MSDWRDDLLDMIEAGLRDIGAVDRPVTVVRMHADMLRHAIGQCRDRPAMVAVHKEAAERAKKVVVEKCPLCGGNDLGCTWGLTREEARQDRAGWR